MSIKTYGGFFCVVLLAGCASQRMLLSQIAERKALSQICGECTQTGPNNPYAKKLLDIKKNVTTTDQIFAMFGDPESVTENIYNGSGGRVEHVQVWRYKSDEYESALIPNPETYGTWANGILKVEFLEGRVVGVSSSEKPSREPRPYWLQTNPKMSAQELAKIKELEKKWQNDVQLTQTNYLNGISEGKTPIPISFYRKALLGGDMKGSACNGKDDVELNIKTVHELMKITNGYATQSMPVTGSFKAVGMSHSPGTPLVDSPVEGYVDHYGFLRLSAKATNLEMELTRDASGTGWSGVVVGNGMGECSDIALTSVRGATTNAFPSPTGKVALKRAQRLIPDNVLTEKIDKADARIAEHWLIVAEQQGDSDASYTLARLYEQKGALAPEFYRRALQYYQSAAEKMADVRAQQALAKMYADGRGTAVNPEEAQRWRAKASATLKRASELCTSPPAIAAIRTIVGKDTAWANTIKMALGTVAGVRVNPGSITGIVVGADNVVSLNKPFVCLVETRRVGAHYNASGVPDIVYVKRDEWGREHYETSSFGPAVRLSAALANAIENSAVYVKRLSMESIDGKKYKISTMNKVKNYSETVEQ